MQELSFNHILSMSWRKACSSAISSEKREGLGESFMRKDVFNDTAGPTEVHSACSKEATGIPAPPLERCLYLSRWLTTSVSNLISKTINTWLFQFFIWEKGEVWEPPGSCHVPWSVAPDKAPAEHDLPWGSPASLLAACTPCPILFCLQLGQDKVSGKQMMKNKLRSSTPTLPSWGALRQTPICMCSVKHRQRGGVWGVGEISVPSTHLCCGPKTALKNTVY